MLEARNVQYQYNKRVVLEDVNVQIELGKIIVLAGENGCGKTTFLKLLAKLLPPKQGQILLNGSQTARDTLASIAFMPDDQHFHPYFNGEQLFYFFETQFHDFQQSKAREIASFLKLDLAEKISKMSKGNISRLKLAATFGRRSCYYLLDEPFEGLDPLVREDLVKSLIQFVDLEKATILMSTNEMDDVSKIADELMILKDGKIIIHENLDVVRSVHGMDAKEWFQSFYK
ncbi:ATP-binding cassette domain-containing protein [Neobacillus soli]|uniref:ATP-binding cassette domain-containing protein n=1 Tax=Neobacillus soli TaxID=220688 RepID=UPI0008244EAD|nr:ATP-binding cassette domain-containing protein [Neobacillus soli]